MCDGEGGAELCVCERQRAKERKHSRWELIFHSGNLGDDILNWKNWELAV